MVYNPRGGNKLFPIDRLRRNVPFCHLRRVCGPCRCSSPFRKRGSIHQLASGTTHRKPAYLPYRRLPIIPNEAALGLARQARAVLALAPAQGNDLMHRGLSRAALAGYALLFAGCISARDTRLPTLGYRDPRAERQSFNYIDPLPDRAGPGYQALPRGFDYPRAEPRRAQEQAAITEAITGGEVPPSNPSVSRYPRSVNP